MITKKLPVLILYVLTSFSLLQAQNAMPEISKQALTRLANQVKTFPQEKLYLHIDKNLYSAGERIWFRAHLIHAALHTPFVMSRYVYVELIDKDNNVVIRRKFRPNEGMHFGQIDLPLDFTQGWYSLRAYTNYMRNLDEEWFYRTNIFIGNTMQKVLESEAAIKPDNKNKKNNITKDIQTYEVGFFPEGGYLITGTLQMTGFKAVNSFGLPVIVSGRIIDNENKEVCTFKSNKNGIGLVSFVPKKGQLYKAVCEDQSGIKRTVNLPSVSDKNFGLSIQQNDSIVMIQTLISEESKLNDTLFLIAHQRGIPVSQKIITPDKLTITATKKGMYSGITDFCLLDRNGNLLSNRIIFINGKDKAKVDFITNKQSFAKRDQVKATATILNSKGQPVKGNFSVSVTDDNDVKIEPGDRTIESYFLLESDVKYPILNPNQYFLNSDKKVASELDVLMINNKWDRYNIPSVVKGIYSRGDTFALEIGSVLTGKVATFPGKRGLPDISVSMLVQKRMHIDAAVTDKDGRFQFQGFEFPDSTQILLHADKKHNFTDIIVDKDTFPEVKIAMPQIEEEVLSEKELKSVLEKRRNKYFYDNGMMVINLDKIEIVAKKEDKMESLRKDRGAMYFRPSQSIGEDKLETAGRIVDALMMVPGITIDDTGNGVLLRNKRPLIMVDNIEYSMEDLSTINPNEVKLIDILKDPGETAIYGSQGANGVICVYLKRGEDLAKINSGPQPWQAVISPLGYTNSFEFRLPEYQNPDVKQSTIPDLRSTIYWKPNVTTDVNGKAELNFYTADAVGTYTVTIQGVTPEGEIINYRTKINRK